MPEPPKKAQWLLGGWTQQRCAPQLPFSPECGLCTWPVLSPPILCAPGPEGGRTPGPSLILSSCTPQHPSGTPDVASSGHKAHSKIFPQSQTNPSYTCHSLRDKGTGHFLPSAAEPWGMLGWTRPWSRPTTSERPLCSVTQAPALQLHMQESVTLLGPRGSSKQALSGYVGTELTYCKGSTLRPGVSDFRGDAVTRDHGRGPKPTCYEPPQVGYRQAQTFYLLQNPLSWLCPLSVPQLLHL